MVKDKNKREMSPLFVRSVALIKAIPKGKVSTYGQISRLIGAVGCARHVSYILASSSRKYGLPWHRVVNSQGKIVLGAEGFLKQKQLLEIEGVDLKGPSIDLDIYLWQPSTSQINNLLNHLPQHYPH